MCPSTTKTTTLGKNLGFFDGNRYRQSYYEQGIKTKKASESHHICRQGGTKEKRVIRCKIRLKILDTKTEKGAVIGQKVMDMEEKKKKTSIRLKKVKEDCPMCVSVPAVRADMLAPTNPQYEIYSASLR